MWSQDAEFSYLNDGKNLVIAIQNNSKDFIEVLKYVGKSIMNIQLQKQLRFQIFI